MKFTVLRHAISVFNETGVSDKDCGLSAAGKEQAKLLTGKYDVVVCSIMKRCRETFAESNIVGDNIFYTEICRELKKDICDYLEGEDESVPETEEQLMRRVANFKDYLCAIYANRKILVISHGDFLNRLTGKAEVAFANAQMVEIEIPQENPDAEIVVLSVGEAPVVEKQVVSVEAPIAVVLETQAVPVESAEAPVVEDAPVAVVLETQAVPAESVEPPSEEAVPAEAVEAPQE